MPQGNPRSCQSPAKLLADGMELGGWQTEGRRDLVDPETQEFQGGGEEDGLFPVQEETQLLEQIDCQGDEKLVVAGYS